jgi:hypothetical protein
MAEDNENVILAAVSARMEAEALAESEALAEPMHHELNMPESQVLKMYPPAATGYGPPVEAPASGVVPLDDFRARLEACVRAGVTVYRDGPLEIRFDPDARRAAAKNDGGEITSF